jgi:hypothetical protein
METFMLNDAVQGAHVYEVLRELPLIEGYFSSVIGSITFRYVDDMVGLVAQSGRAPGFYSIEKKPDGRGFKSLRARLPGR